MGTSVVLSIDVMRIGGSVRRSAAAQPPEGEVVAPDGERVHAVRAERPVAGGPGLHASGWVARVVERRGLRTGGRVRLSSRQSAGRAGGGRHGSYSRAVMKASLILHTSGTVRNGQ